MAQIRQYEQTGAPTPYPNVMGGQDVGPTAGPQVPMTTPAPPPAPGEAAPPPPPVILYPNSRNGRK